MPESPPPAGGPRRPSNSLNVRSALVAAGILISRLAGLARTRIFGIIFGQDSWQADAWNAAFRIPNLLQNLLGDGVLSASLIPVYARVRKERGQDEADALARTILALLALITAVIVLAGVTLTPYFVDVVAGGFTGEKRDLTILLTRLIFPGVGLLVGSAWCLAILNSHGKFFNSYVAPAAWNGAIIVGLLLHPREQLTLVAGAAAWGAVIGSALQVLVQLPQVLGVMSAGWLRTRLVMTAHVRQVLTSSVPVILSRGAVQVSAFIDSAIASHLTDGPMTALANAQQMYMLPVSLFGMAISAAALPTMSSADHHEDSRELAHHLIDGQRTLLVLMVPSVVGFLAFGDVMAGVLYEAGRFSRQDSLFLWSVVAGSAVGLIAQTIGRFYASAFFALGDTTTPARFAFIRIGLVIALGFAMAFGIPWAFGLPLKWGAGGLTLSAGIAGWVEFALLRAALRKRIKDFDLPGAFLAKCWAAALGAAAVATSLRFVIPTHFGWFRYAGILLAFGVLYLIAAALVGTLSLAEIKRAVRRR